MDSKWELLRSLVNLDCDPNSPLTFCFFSLPGADDDERVGVREQWDWEDYSQCGDRQDQNQSIQIHQQTSQGYHHSVHAKRKSFINENKNKIGPRIGPLGTPSSCNGTFK